MSLIVRRPTGHRFRLPLGPFTSSCRRLLRPKTPRRQVPIHPTTAFARGLPHSTLSTSPRYPRHPQSHHVPRPHHPPLSRRHYLQRYRHYRRHRYPTPTVSLSSRRMRRSGRSRTLSRQLCLHRTLCLRSLHLRMLSCVTGLSRP